MNVLLAHSQFKTPGGAEIVSARIIDWLLRERDANVTVLTLSAPVSEELDALSGIRLQWDRIRIEVVSAPSVLTRDMSRGDLLRRVVLMRAAQRLSGGFDCCVSTCGEVDFARPSVQYIHFPMMMERRDRRAFGMVAPHGSLDTLPGLTTVYERTMRSIAHFDPVRFRKNILMTNSSFTAGVVRETYGVDPIVAYPLPTEQEQRSAGALDWNRRPIDIAASLRLAADKHLERLADVFVRMAALGTLRRIIVTAPSQESRPREQFDARLRDAGIQCETYVGLSRQEQLSLLERTRVFIHARENEHFGMGVADAIAMGCIPVVHDSGGPRELVPFAALRFRDPQGAAEAMKRLAADARMRSEVRVTLAKGLQKLDEHSLTRALECVVPKPGGRMSLRGRRAIPTGVTREIARPPIVMTEFRPGIHAGIGVAVANLKQGLIDTRRWDVTAVPSGRHREGNPWPLRVWHQILDLVELSRRLSRTQPKICHLNSVLAPGALVRDAVSVRLCKTVGAKVLVQFHGTRQDILSLRWGPKAWLRDRILANADVLAVLSSEEVENLVRRRVPRTKIRLVANAVIVPKSRPTGGAIARRDAPKILFASRFDPGKGLREVVESFAHLKEMGSPAHLTLAGDGLERRGAEEVVRRKGLGSSVSFTGWLSEQRVMELYRIADVLLFPTRYAQEGFPLVILHALSVGLPIITTRYRAMADHLNEPDNCFFLDDVRPETIARRTAELLDRPALRRTMRNNNIRLARTFSPERVVLRVESIYNDLLGTGRQTWP